MLDLLDRLEGTGTFEITFQAIDVGPEVLGLA